MPDIFPGSALVDIYLELQGQKAFRDEYQYLVDSQVGTPLGRFFEIVNEADDDVRIKELTDFFLDYHIPFPKDRDRSDYFANFKYQNLQLNRELQIVLDLYCYAYEKYVLNIVEDQDERNNLEAIRGQLKEMGYVVFEKSLTMKVEKTERNKEKLRYYINKAHMQDESQIAPKYKELLERSIADYMGVNSPTIENFRSMIGTIEVVAPIIGSKEVKELLLAMDFANLGEGEVKEIEALANGVAKSFLENKIKEDKFKSVITGYMNSRPAEKNFKSLIQLIKKALEELDANDVRKILHAMDFTKLSRSEIKEIDKLSDRDVVKKLLQDKIKEDKVIKEAKLILDAYPNSQAAKDISSEISALRQSGETVRLTTACKNAYQKYNGDRGAYKKEILKLCAPKIKVRIRKSLEEIDEKWGLSQERASRRPNIIGYARQLFQRFQGQRSERELEIGQRSEVELEIGKESVADLNEAENQLIAISNDVIQSVNEEYGLASTHFGEVIMQVREKDRRHVMYKADTLANDPFVKTGDLISKNLPIDAAGEQRDQIVIDSLGKYCAENVNAPLVKVIDIISKINTLVVLTRTINTMFKVLGDHSGADDLENIKMQVGTYVSGHNELVAQLRETKYANIIPRLEEAKAHVDALLLALPSDRNSQRHTLS